MNISYWKNRWEKGNTGWHMDHVYPLLPKLWPQFNLPANAKVLVPLCGKSIDLLWLLQKNFHVIGIEVSAKAIKQLERNSSLFFTCTNRKGHTVFEANSMEIWKDDFLNISPDVIGKVDAIYDKAALIALPPEIRKKYIPHLQSFCHSHTQILLQTFEYKQEEMQGPPFSVSQKELRTYFNPNFEIKLLYEKSKLNEFERFKERGLTSYFIEKVYQIYPK
ncbi:thiopurine S-methyltransferase [Aliifodinibius salicampi]|uniref:Thiopurine S-methyltransferase n=1 Tax=Fodinibius salicampi TaxID=1920655 RepID=A0ABT3PYD3_9BACT|nr:thiopurine S-methyltransferase [Fodinibius salicampi]MCW9712857.1 thiopurine S-methyltransferase [Fodinibius salicampi]